MRCHLMLYAMIFFSALSCAPKEKNKGADNRENGALNADDAGNDGKSLRAIETKLSGRTVDLYAVRAGLTRGFEPPELDKLPCSYFRQGQGFQIPAIPGGPPIALPGPLQNHYAGVWNGVEQYRFKVSAYNRIYHDPGIPDWLLTAPTSRAIEYVAKLFDVTVINPTQAICTISARALN